MHSNLEARTLLGGVFEEIHDFDQLVLGLIDPGDVVEGDLRILLLAAGIITYDEGRITVLNRAKMEKRACTCYKIVRDEESRLLPQKAGKVA